MIVSLLFFLWNDLNKKIDYYCTVCTSQTNPIFLDQNLMSKKKPQKKKRVETTLVLPIQMTITRESKFPEMKCPSQESKKRRPIALVEAPRSKSLTRRFLLKKIVSLIISHLWIITTRMTNKKIPRQYTKAPLKKALQIFPSLQKKLITTKYQSLI